MAAKEIISAEIVTGVTTVDSPRERAVSLPHSAKTSQSLEQASLRKETRKSQPPTNQSSVARHLVESDACARAYNATIRFVLFVFVSQSLALM